MEYRSLGKSGLQLSAFSLGSWVTFGRQVQAGGAREMMALAYDHGVNFFDNAEGYEQGESERLMGEALQRLGWPRDTWCVSSKVFWGGDRPTQQGLSRKHVTEACHAGLRRLQVDYLDLFFCHRPDILTPIEETVRAMDDLVRQGKVLYWGTSEWNAQQITEAYAVAAAHHLTPPTMEQPQYHLFHRDKFERDLKPLFEHYGLGSTIFSPLASGLLTGKYSDGIPRGSRITLENYEWLAARFTSEEGQDRIAKTRRLQTLAQAAGMKVHHLALLWCLRNPHVSSVILGASSAGQLQDNLSALESADRLTDDMMGEIEAIVDNRPEPFSTFR
jgi:voltage-dependent potassium channel beta subunit